MVADILASTLRSVVSGFMVRALWRICLGQALALVGTTVYVLVRLVGPGIHDRALLAIVAAFTLGLAALLALGERALERGDRWPLMPLCMAEVLAALFAADMVEAGVLGYAALVGLPSLAALAGLAVPVARRGRAPG
jgi:hypothetical protein